MTFKNTALFGILFITLFSCSDDTQEHVNTKPKPQLNSESYEPIEVLFNEKEFTDTLSEKLLNEIKICNSEAQADMGIDVPDCSPEFFKLFPLNHKESLNNGFILLTKANTGGVGLRRTLIFEREQGSLVKVNGFVANLIAQRKTTSGYNDLLLRFADRVEGDLTYYNCLFTWQNGKYEFQYVESIYVPASDWAGKVKESLRDSVSKDIYKIIEDNQMIF